MLYVLGIDNAPRAWVLSLESFASRTEAGRAIAWQIGGGASRAEDWAICTYDRARDSFMSDDGRTFRPERSIHSSEEWREFRARLRAQSVTIEGTISL